MNCDNVKENIPFLDDESLETDIAEEVRAHCQSCDSCSEELRIIRNIISGVRSVMVEQEPEVSNENVERIMNAIHKRKTARIFYQRISTAAAVAVFVVFAAMYGIMSRNIGTVPEVFDLLSEQNVELYEDYLASQYLTGAEMPDLVNGIETDDEDTEVDLYLAENYHSLNPEDIIEIMDDDEFEMLFASIY